eukprot:Rhum_TRINITY_DN10967_c0_g1::Rhum_TRINITY_DN10967_c0_g1_i1::g.41578::m.41578
MARELPSPLPPPLSPHTHTLDNSDVASPTLRFDPVSHRTEDGARVILGEQMPVGDCVGRSTSHNTLVVVQQRPQLLDHAVLERDGGGRNTLRLRDDVQHLKRGCPHGLELGERRAPQKPRHKLAQEGNAGERLGARVGQRPQDRQGGRRNVAVHLACAVDEGGGDHRQQLLRVGSDHLLRCVAHDGGHAREQTLFRLVLASLVVLLQQHRQHVVVRLLPPQQRVLAPNELRQSSHVRLEQDVQLLRDACGAPRPPGKSGDDLQGRVAGSSALRDGTPGQERRVRRRAAPFGQRRVRLVDAGRHRRGKVRRLV